MVTGLISGGKLICKPIRSHITMPINEESSPRRTTVMKLKDIVIDCPTTPTFDLLLNKEADRKLVFDCQSPLKYLS